MTKPPEVIDCVECGGSAHLLSYLPEDGHVDPGAVLAYRCADCLDRFDLVWDDSGEEEVSSSSDAL